MVKLCIEKMLILRCILPKKTEPLIEKKLTLHPLKKLEHPENNHNPLKKPLSLWKKIASSPPEKKKSSNSTEQTQF